MGRKKKIKNKSKKLIDEDYIIMDEKLDEFLSSNSSPDEDDVNQQEMFNLLCKDVKPSIDWSTIKTALNGIGLKLRELGSILLDRIVYEYKTASKMQMVIFILVIILGYKMFWKQDDGLLFNKNAMYPTEFGSMKRMTELKKRHYYYVNSLTGEEVLIRWTELFYNTNYRMDGNYKYNEADCVSSTFLFLQFYGYNGRIMNVQGLDDTITRLNRAGFQKIRSSLSDIKCGDLILFKPVNGVPHVGIVYAIKGSYIRYVDVNGAYGRGDMVIGWGDWRINKVAEVSFAFFCGEFFKEFNTVAPVGM